MGDIGRPRSLSRWNVSLSVPGSVFVAPWFDAAGGVVPGIGPGIGPGYAPRIGPGHGTG